MRGLMLVIFSLLFATSVLAQGNPSPTENKTYYDDGKLHTKEFLLNDQRVGVFKEYWPNQKMKQKATYNLEGQLHGYIRYHNEAGVVIKRENYENGTLVSTIDYEQGQPVEEEE